LQSFHNFVVALEHHILGEQWEPTAGVRKQTLTDIFIDEGDKDGRLRCLMSQRTS
jgi:hypothetical protein